MILLKFVIQKITKQANGNIKYFRKGHKLINTLLNFFFL